MRNLIPFLGTILICSTSFSQAVESIDTIRFSADSSYSRIVVRYNKDQLLFGTSKTGVIAVNEKNKSTKTIIPPSTGGEFRDLVVNKKNFYAIVSGDVGMVYKGNQDTAQLIFSEGGIFLDDISLQNKKLMILGDPIFDRFTILSSPTQSTAFNDFKSINQNIGNQLGEGCYAASGTCAQYFNPETYFFVSGGERSARFHRLNLKSNSTSTVNLPLKKGEGCGPFSLFFWNSLNGVVVGGDYKNSSEATQNACFTTDGGLTWKASETCPNGYRSCVTGNSNILFSCGTSGIDYSIDGGKNWKFLMKGNFCALLLEGNTLYATTNKGTCLRLKLKM